MADLPQDDPDGADDQERRERHRARRPFGELAEAEHADGQGADGHAEQANRTAPERGGTAVMTSVDWVAPNRPPPTLATG